MATTLVRPVPTASISEEVGRSGWLYPRWTHPWPVEAGPDGRAVRPWAASAGTTHPTGGRLARRARRAQGRRRGPRGRAPVHVAAGCARPGIAHGDVGGARAAA